MNLKKIPGLSLTNSKMGIPVLAGLLNYEKTKPYAKRIKGYTTTFAKPDKKNEETAKNTS
ncbi:hypothetical protein [Flavobacterium sp.]|uniref:hypothetical protein n=1 Tax=Flavobacterium sp. TaxID=239 RepID=UPI00261D2299|nr:hypothetical protein [Flavobacterium sp.]